MKDTQRKSIVRKSKRKINWYNESQYAQDKEIEKICIDNGFTLSEFYATDGKKLNKILQYLASAPTLMILVDYILMIYYIINLKHY